MEYNIYYGPNIFQIILDEGCCSQKKVREVFNASNSDNLLDNGTFADENLAIKAKQTFELINSKFKNLSKLSTGRAINLFLVKSPNSQIYNLGDFTYVLFCNEETIMRAVVTLVGNVFLYKTFDNHPPAIIKEIIDLFKVKSSVELFEIGVVNPSLNNETFNAFFYLATINSSTDPSLEKELKPFENIKAICPKPFEKEVSLCDFIEICFQLMFAGLNQGTFSNSASIRELFWTLGDVAMNSLGLDIESGCIKSSVKPE